jgi:hypothetical protein
MTATATTTQAPPAAPAPAPVSASAKPKARRRWHRIAIPFGLLLALVVTTFVMHSLNEPDREDAAFLSPLSQDTIGGSQLAQMLRDKGISVERQTKTSDALVAGFAGGVTLFVPAPELMHRDYLHMLWAMPSNTRVVLVEPSGADLGRSAAPIYAAGTRWAVAPASPRADGGPCTVPGLRDAGWAAVLRTAYVVDPDALLREHSCYQGGVLQFRWTVGEIVAVGAADPFRNDRIGEFDNASLAVGLLSTYSRLVWLDVHEKEPGPLVDPNAEPGAGGPSLAPDDSGIGDGGQGDGGTGTGDGNGNGDPTSGGAGDGGQASGDGRPSFFSAFPTSLWATLLGLLLLVLLLALWQARRLGPPVLEPLPVTVRGSETVLGRARLYQRAGAMITGAQTLRRSTGPQIAQALGLPSTTSVDDLATAITARYGGEEADYLAVLADDVPKKDADLVALAASLDALLAMVSTPPVFDPPTASGPAAVHSQADEPQGETRG